MEYSITLPETARENICHALLVAADFFADDRELCSAEQPVSQFSPVVENCLTALRLVGLNPAGQVVTLPLGCWDMICLALRIAAKDHSAGRHCADCAAWSAGQCREHTRSRALSAELTAIADHLDENFVVQLMTELDLTYACGGHTPVTTGGAR